MAVRKMKEKCKDAARMRREKERAEFVELSKLLPLPVSTTSQLDKASIIRLTSSYLRMRAAFPKGLGENWGTLKGAVASSSNYDARIASSVHTVHHDYQHQLNSVSSNLCDAPSSGDSLQQQQQQQRITDNKQASLRNQITHSHDQTSEQRTTHIRELGSLILQTLDGFVFALHRDGKIMYISETVSVLLGLPQIDLTGSSIFEYVHPADHNDLVDLLNLSEQDRLDIESQSGDSSDDKSREAQMLPSPPDSHLELGRSFCMRMKCILPKRNAGLVHNGYKAIHCTGYLKVKHRSQAPQVTRACFGGGGSKRNDQQPVKGISSRSCDQEWDSYALVAVGHSLLPSASIEVKLNTTSFMFRANLDMKLFYIETPASNLLGHSQADFIGRTLYQFVHVADTQLLEQAHRSLLSKSQVVSRYFRLMRKGPDESGALGGSLWMQMCATLINNPRSMPRSQHIVAFCMVIGDNQLDESRISLPCAESAGVVATSWRPTAASGESSIHQQQTSTTSVTQLDTTAAVVPAMLTQTAVSAVRRPNQAASHQMTATRAKPDRNAGRPSLVGKKKPLKGKQYATASEKILPRGKMRKFQESRKSQASIVSDAESRRTSSSENMRSNESMQYRSLEHNSQALSHSFTSQTIGSLRRPSEDSIVSSVASTTSSSSSCSRPATATIATANFSSNSQYNNNNMIPSASFGPCSLTTCSSTSVCSSASSSVSSSGSSNTSDLSPNLYGALESQHHDVYPYHHDALQPLQPQPPQCDLSSPIAQAHTKFTHKLHDIDSSMQQQQQPIYLLHPQQQCPPEDSYAAVTSIYDSQDVRNHHWPVAMTNTYYGQQTAVDHERNTHMSSGQYYHYNPRVAHDQEHAPVEDSDGCNMLYYDQHIDYTTNYHDECGGFVSRHHQADIMSQSPTTACFVGVDHSLS